MTEEIIIDGVDVAGCKLYDYGICDSEMADDLNCDKNHTCYYKQLKRLEQENKELKEEKYKYYQQTLDDEILMNELSLEVDLRKKESDFYLEKLSKYRSALEEIRERVSRHYPGIPRDILDIINEVLNP